MVVVFPLPGMPRIRLKFSVIIHLIGTGMIINPTNYSISLHADPGSRGVKNLPERQKCHTYMKNFRIAFVFSDSSYINFDRKKKLN